MKNSWKCCGFGLFSCWQLWFHEKNCLKKFWWKTRENVGGFAIFYCWHSWFPEIIVKFCQNWIFGQKFDFSNSVLYESWKRKNNGFFFFFAKCKKEEANFSHFAIMLILTWKMKIFQFFLHPSASEKPNSENLQIFWVLFWHLGLFTVFPDRYANWNVGLADKKWSKLLIPIARPLSIAKGVWNVPRLRKRWFVDPMVSFILQNAKCTEKIAGNLLSSILTCSRRIWKSSKKSSYQK